MSPEISLLAIMRMRSMESAPPSGVELECMPGMGGATW